MARLDPSSGVQHEETESFARDLRLMSLCAVAVVLILDGSCST